VQLTQRDANNANYQHIDYELELQGWKQSLVSALGRGAQMNLIRGTRTTMSVLLCAATLGVGISAGALISAPSTVSAATLGSTIASIALGQQGVEDNPANSYCNPYSGHWGDGTSCASVGGQAYRAVEWCADFAAWAWQQAGVSFTYGSASSDINADSNSFYYWALANGTWHAAGSGYTPQAGDVAVYGTSAADASHVGVVASNGSSGPNVVNGDWEIDYPNDFPTAVYYQTNEVNSDGGNSDGDLDGYASPASSGPPPVVGTTTDLTSSSNPSSFGQDVTFTATVTPTSSTSSQPSGDIQFFEDGTPIGTESVASDQASITTANLSGGTHGITAQYGGDSNFTGSSGSLNQVVNPDPTSTGLSSSVNPALTGQSVTYTASVNPVPDGGSVTFNDNGASICISAGVNTSSGQATCTVTYEDAQAGIHLITAAFSGDADFANSSSGAFSEDVLIPTTTAVTSSANPSVPQEPVVFSATVNPIPDGGTVAFTDDGNPISGCAAMVINSVSGTAACSLTYTSNGSHNVVATYSGDDLYASSEDTLTQAVVPIVVTVSPNPAGMTGDSEVNSVVQVKADPKYAGLYVLINSSQLVGSCGRVLFEYLPSSTNTVALVQRGQIVTKIDQEGNATVDLEGNRCTPGESTIGAQLELSSIPSANSLLPGTSTTLDVVAAGVSSPGITAVPNDEVETGQNSAVYTVFEIQTTPALAGTKVTISSAQLSSSCIGWALESDGGIVQYGNGGSTATSHEKLDKNGNASFVFEGVGCAPGTSAVSAVMAGTTYPTRFTVLPSQP
jgi:Big-like domain-containing protein/CHAP domain-containing protein